PIGKTGRNEDIMKTSKNFRLDDYSIAIINEIVNRTLCDDQTEVIEMALRNLAFNMFTEEERKRIYLDVAKKKYESI
ncbi:MAG: hypothetical protein QXI16_07025, partial [Sulfolobaceae archaeon]